MPYSNRRLWYVILLLTLAATLSFIDRQILAVMIGPIKRDLGGLSDTKISLLIGLAFTLIYTAASLPLARLADRSNRRNVIAAGIFSWSLMTSMAGVASTYWQLFLARMGVGVGEASLGPASTSMLADYFEKHRLPLAFGFVSAAPFLGTGLASIVGGPLIDYLEARPRMALPVFGELFSWQVALMAVGLPGLLLAALMFTIEEPPRKGRLPEADNYPLRAVLAFAFSRRRYLAMHFTAYLCLSIQGFAFLTWVVEFFVRKHGWTRTEIGLTYGIISMVAGILGSVWAGYYAGRLIQRGVSDAAMRLTLGCTLVLGPLAIVMPLVDSGLLALAFCVPMTWCMAMPPGLSSTALQAITPNRMRGQLIAFYAICVSFLSYLVAPLIIGLMNDYVFKREDAIHLSLTTLAVFNYSIATICLLLALAPLRAALDEARKWEAPAEDAG